MDTKEKLMMAFRKSIRLVDNPDDIFVIDNDIQLKVNGFYISIRKDYINKDVKGYFICHKHIEEQLTDTELESIRILAYEKFNQVQNEHQSKLKKECMEELDNFIIDEQPLAKI